MRISKIGLIVLLQSAFVYLSAFANDTSDLKIRLLVFGDSLSAGYGLMEQNSFPAQLQEALDKRNYNVFVVNGGVSGDTTAGGAARIDWYLSDQPRLVIVELGANDALRGLDVDSTYLNLERILLRLNQNGARIILAGMKAPRNLGDEYVARFDGIYPELANKHQATLYPFFLEGVALDPLLNQPDGIHPNARGVKTIVEKILPVVISELDKIKLP